MNADEMFEDLGYEKDTTQEGHIVYHHKCYIFIDFDLESKDVFKYNNSGFKSAIDMEILKAINKQCKELHWL